MLFALFVGLGPLNKLTIGYAKIYRPNAKPAQTAMVSQR